MIYSDLFRVAFIYELTYSTLTKVELDNQMSNLRYGRGQVEWALWKSFSLNRSVPSGVPKPFRTRIKRLLDIDRELDLSDESLAPATEFAFAEPPTAAGIEVAYFPVDTFCLAVGLDLLDSGFKQSEVVFLMRYLRPDLEVRMPSLLERPSLTRRSRHSAENYPNLPTYLHNGRRYADARLFVVISKVELTELFPASPKTTDTPMFLEPAFCDGVEALGQHLSERMPDRRRVVVVLELAATAQATASFLEKAPVIRRGRPKA